jgi:hypothetical protein
MDVKAAIEEKAVDTTIQQYFPAKMVWDTH